MRVRTKALALALPLLAFAPALVSTAGCEQGEPPVANEVFVMRVCPSGVPCTPIADDQSTVTLEGCFANSVENPRTDLTAEFTITAGTWTTPLPQVDDARTARVPLTGRCALATFRVPAVPQQMRAQLRLARVTGTAVEYLPYTQMSIINLEPSSIEEVQLLPATGAEFLTPSAFVMNVDVRAKTGRPSNGTRVTLRAVPADATAPVRINPTSMVLSSSSVASFTVLAGTNTAVRFIGEATPPPPIGATATPATSASGTLEMTTPATP